MHPICNLFPILTQLVLVKSILSIVRVWRFQYYITQPLQMIGLETTFLNYFYLKILHSKAADFWKKLRYVINNLEALSCFIVTNLWRPRLKAPMLISFNYSLYLGAFFLVIILLCWSWAHAKLQLFGIPLTSDEWFMILKNFLASFGCCKIFSLISFGDVFRF